MSTADEYNSQIQEFSLSIVLYHAYKIHPMDAFASSSDWANLPAHILDLVAGRLLSSSDYLRFSVVCNSWFQVAKHNQSQHKSHLEPPMLMFFNKKEEAWGLYNVLDNKVLDLHSRLPKKRFCGSSKGWLVLAEQDFSVTLIKPSFTKSKYMAASKENIIIRLPQIKPPELSREEDIGRELWIEEGDCDYYVVKATITSDPILNPNEYVVVIIYMEHCQMAFIRPGKDATWTYLSTNKNQIADVIHRPDDDKFYALGQHGNFRTFSIANPKLTFLDSTGIPPNAFIRKYLVDSNGKEDWLMVDRDCDWEDDEKLEKRFANEFRVYEFNSDKCVWIEKETLGDDVALFIGENLSLRVVASNFPGCKKNCIYYNHDYDFINYNMLNDFGVYDIETKSISKPYSKDVMDLLEMDNQRPIWFTPTFKL